MTFRHFRLKFVVPPDRFSEWNKAAAMPEAREKSKGAGVEPLRSPPWLGACSLRPVSIRLMDREAKVHPFPDVVRKETGCKINLIEFFGD